MGVRLNEEERGRGFVRAEPEGRPTAFSL
jgi:hypothetical protein